MRINKKLTSISEKQESTIKALKEVYKKMKKYWIILLLLLICFEVRRCAASLCHNLLHFSYLGFREMQQRVGRV